MASSDNEAARLGPTENSQDEVEMDEEMLAGWILEHQEQLLDDEQLQVDDDDDSDYREEVDEADDDEDDFFGK